MQGFICNNPPRTHPRSRLAVGCGASARAGHTDLGHVDVEVEGEVAAAQHRQMCLVGPVLAHPRDVNGEHRVHGMEHRHRHVEALQRQLSAIGDAECAGLG